MKELGSLLLIEQPEESIPLHTRLRNPIRNAVDPPPRWDQIQKYARLLGKHPNWSERKPACGGYNCAGLVWASRRTGIFDEDQISLIFRDDGYRKLKPGERLQVGDLVTYWSKPPPARYFVHVGMVVEIRQAMGFEASVPWLLSKLDAVSGEVLHSAFEIEFPGLECDKEYWTERPLPT